MFPEIFHSLVIYTFFGHLFAYFLVLFLIRLLKIESPRQKIQLYLVSILSPILIFILYGAFVGRRCQVGSYYGTVYYEMLSFLCNITTMALYIIAPLSGFFILFGLIKAFAGVLYMQKLKKQIINVSSTDKERVERILGEKSQDLKISKVPEVIFSSSNRFFAFTAGFIRPVVVLNIAVIDNLSDNEINEIIVHELIHIKRGDATIGWLLELVKNLFIYSPFCTFLVSKYKLEIERSCDKEVVKHTGQTTSYAKTLLKAWRILCETDSFQLGAFAGLTGSESHMEARINSLLNKKSNENRLSLLMMISLMTFLLISTFSFLWFIC